MYAVDRLRRDHLILRSKLNVLEGALGMGQDAWFVLREVCLTLSRQLQDHIKREEELVAACRKAMPPHVLAEVTVEHHDEPEHLRTVNRLFVSAQGQDLARITPMLTGVIQGLRRHMDEEEVILFPVLERVLAQADVPSNIPPMGHRLDDTMTVNRIVHQFPSTKRVFDRLFVNVPYEGCQCLDEVAWTHGLEVEDLLKTLDQAIVLEAVQAEV